MYTVFICVKCKEMKKSLDFYKCKDTYLFNLFDLVMKMMVFPIMELSSLGYLLHICFHIISSNIIRGSSIISNSLWYYYFIKHT